jgi:carbamoyltransferase
VNLLGISGIHGTVEFKRQLQPELSERELRISQGHDSAAALVVDGEVIAAVAEERLSRRKHTGDFPLGAIGACLSHAGLSLDGVDEIAHGFDYAPYRSLYSLDPTAKALYEGVLSPAAFARRVQVTLGDRLAERVRHVDHHLAHAASAYFTSGWEECLVIVIDGMGEAYGASVYVARAGGLEPIHRISALDSIGILYSLVTLHLGFEFNADEYKVMGLAPYGDAQRFGSFFAQQVQLRPDGGWRIPLLKLGTSAEDRATHLSARRHLSEHLLPAREPDGPLGAEHQDAAAAVQQCLDRALLHLCEHFAQRTGMRRLALAGGVALNTTANARLVASGVFDEIYIQPAAADDGTALGAALWRSSLTGEVRNRRSPTPFYGPAETLEQTEHALRSRRGEIDVQELGSTAAACETAAAMIASGDVVAWHRGRLEFGPRALGHRSILADPRRPEMRDRVNALVKLREMFRPFAPAVSIEDAHRWFDVSPMTELPYMNVNVSVRPEHRAALPATTHVDGSARLQTVSRHDNPEFAALLDALKRETGMSIVLNTSFNVKGQPIVNTAAEALDTLLDTGIQALFLGNILVRPAAGRAAR